MTPPADRRRVAPDLALVGRRALLRRHVPRGAGRRRAGRGPPVPRRPLLDRRAGAVADRPAPRPARGVARRHPAAGWRCWPATCSRRSACSTPTPPPRPSSPTSWWCSCRCSRRSSTAAGPTRRPCRRGHRGGRAGAAHRPVVHRRVRRGEVLTLGCALAFGVHVLVVSSAARHHDPIRLTAIQVGVVGALAPAPGLFVGGYGFPATALGAADRHGGRGDGRRLRAAGVRASGPVPPHGAALLLLLGSPCSRRSWPPSRAIRSAGPSSLGAGVDPAWRSSSASCVPPALDRGVRLREAALDNGRYRGGTALVDPKKPRAPFAPWDRRELPGIFTRRGDRRRASATTSGSRCACSRCSAAGWPPCPSST